MNRHKPDIAELRRLMDRATPVPWKRTSGLSGIEVRADEGKRLICHMHYVKGDDNSDAIVAAVNALPQLLAAYEEAEKLRERLREVLRQPHASDDDIVSFVREDYECSRQRPRNTARPPGRQRR